MENTEQSRGPGVEFPPRPVIANAAAAPATAAPPVTAAAPAPTAPAATVPAIAAPTVTHPAPRSTTAPEPDLDIEHGWSADLVAPGAPFNTRTATTRALMGVALSSLYGLALGARDGGWALLSDSLAVPTAVVAVCVVGIPALYIAFAFLDAPIEPKGMATASARSLATTGLVLAGLAPAAALFTVTTEGRGAAVILAALGLLLAAFLGFRTLLAEISGLLAGAPMHTKFAAGIASLVFCIFAVMLSARVMLTSSALFSFMAAFEGAS